MLNLVTIALVLGLYWRIRMNDAEKEALAKLSTELGELSSAFEAEKAANVAKDAQIAQLESELKTANDALAAAQSDPAEVVAAVDALTAKVDAELNPPAPAADPTPAS